jgi:serine/threonine-protein kinase
VIGTNVGNYRIERLIGEGGMGKVYEAIHPSIGRSAAVKILPAKEASDPQVISRFLTEARASNAIRHPNIVDIYDCGVLPGGTPYIVMEYLAGETLGQVLAKGRVPLDVALDWACQVAEALSAAHAHDVVHRDLKPDNLFLIDDPRRLDCKQVKVLDFGIAKLQSHALGQVYKTRTGSLLGTPLYMSPEQCLGVKDIDARTDVYSFGVILYEMVCGRKPFDGDAVFTIINMHINEKPVAPRELEISLPQTLESIILRALAKSPSERYDNMAELLSELELVRGNTQGSNDALARFTRNRINPTPISGVPVSFAELQTLGDTAVSKKTTAHSHLTSSLRKRRVAAGVVGFVILGVGYWVIRRIPHGQILPERTTLITPPNLAHPEPTAPTPNNITLESIPAGATITVDGVAIGVTPLNYRTHQVTKPVEFVFTHKSYIPERLWAVPTPGMHLRAELAPVLSIPAPTQKGKHSADKPQELEKSDIKFER